MFFRKTKDKGFILIGIFLISLIILIKDYISHTTIFTTNFNHKLSSILEKNFSYHENTYKYIDYLSAKKTFSLLINSKNKIAQIDPKLQDIYGFDIYLSKIDIRKEFIEIKNNQNISYLECMRLIYDPLESEKNIYMKQKMSKYEYKTKIDSLYETKKTPLFVMMCNKSMDDKVQIFIDQNNYIIVEGEFRK
jgi:hypothetical protein